MTVNKLRCCLNRPAERTDSNKHKNYFRMKNFYPVKKADDEVRLCKGNTCIQARADNAKLLTFAFAFMLICVGIAALSTK